VREETAAQKQWLDAATRKIRFKPDRIYVRAELAGHLEDKMADLARIFPDLPAEEIQARALWEMGDAAGIGQELAQIYRPWLGWMWQASQWILGFALATALLFWAGRGISTLEERQMLEQVNQGKVPYGEQVDEYFLAGDPEAAFPISQGWDDIVRTPLQRIGSTEWISAGYFFLRVERSVLWSFVDKSAQNAADRAPRYVLECELAAAGLPWQPLHVQAVSCVQGSDSLGNTYLSMKDMQALEQNGQRSILVSERSRRGPLERYFRLSIDGVSPKAEWICLEYDWGGETWTLTIPLAGL
jgi:hypothetical protein